MQNVLNDSLFFNEAQYDSIERPDFTPTGEGYLLLNRTSNPFGAFLTMLSSSGLR
jgi:hypothetical protein